MHCFPSFEVKLHSSQTQTSLMVCCWPTRKQAANIGFLWFDPEVVMSSNHVLMIESSWNNLCHGLIIARSLRFCCHNLLLLLLFEPFSLPKLTEMWGDHSGCFYIFVCRSLVGCVVFMVHDPLVELKSQEIAFMP